MPSVDTTPNYPAQHDQWVEKAARDLPPVLQDMTNETNFGATDPGHGHRIVLANNLVEELSKRGGHTKAAAAWAIHQLVQKGRLVAEIGVEIERPIIGHRPDENSTVVKARRFFGSHADSPRHQIPVYGAPVKKPMAQTDRPVPYDCLLVRSDPALWEWWKTTLASPEGVVPKQSAPQPIESILFEATRRKELLAKLTQVQDRLEKKRKSVVQALASFRTAIAKWESADREPINSDRQHANLGDSFLQVCQALREGDFGHGVEEILNGDRGDVGGNARLAIDLYRRAWCQDRQGLVDLLAKLDELPWQGDNFSTAAPSQRGVWDAVRSRIETIIPLPYSMGAIHPWHPDAMEAFGLQAELSSDPSQASAALPLEQAPNDPSCQPICDEMPEYADIDQPWSTPLPPTKEMKADELIRLPDIVDLVIMTANEVERDAVVRVLKPLPRKRRLSKGFIGPETYFAGKFGTFNAVVTKCRMGAVGPGSAILAAEEARRRWRPKATIMIGIGFGKDPKKQRIGDVLIASEVIPYEPQRVGTIENIDRGMVVPSNPTLLNRFENAFGWEFFRPDRQKAACQVGPILSGEKLVDDPNFKASLFGRYPHAIGGEMEGAGLGAVAFRSNHPFILVKSICDWGDGNKHKKYQALAAAAAVSLVHFVLSQEGALHGLGKPSPGS